MNKFLVKFFYNADMLFMALFIIAAVVVDIPWLTITTAIVLLLFGIAGSGLCPSDAQRAPRELHLHLCSRRHNRPCCRYLGCCWRMVVLNSVAYE